MNKRLLEILKNLCFIILVLPIMAISFSSCTDDEDSPPPNREVLGDVFSIQGATITSGTLPSNPDGPSVGDVNINGTVIAGGSSHVTITTDNDIKELYVSIEGASNYYTIKPSSTKSNVFDFTILLSQSLNHSFDILISGLLANGTNTKIYKTSITYYSVGTGGSTGLQVSLSFDNEKDVDLYVIQPDGVIIYYGNKGSQIYDTLSGQYVYWWGLDLDSNPACGIDSINNENVFYPDSIIQNGVYQVWINMYMNCDPTIATTCVVTANESGQLLNPTYGNNPSTHTYPIGEPSNSIASDTTGAFKVMEFTISGASPSPVMQNYNTPLTESARNKLNWSIANTRF